MKSFPPIFRLYSLPSLILLACGGGGSRQTATAPSDMGQVEIRDFQGQQLDSYSKFVENSIRGPQEVDINTWRLSLTGMVQRPAVYTYDQILSRPAFQKVTLLHCVDDWKVNVLWEGFKLRDMLDEAGVKPGANYVVFYGVDGYYTFLTYNYIITHDLLVAYKMNGLTLKPQRGYPLELVAEDRLGFKWCRWVTRIDVTDSSGVKGYWESQGYPASGDPAEWFK